MKAYFLNPPFLPNFVRSVRGQGSVARASTLYYPIWLAYAAGVTEEVCDIRLVDAIARNWSEDDVVRDTLKFKPDLVIIDTNFASLNHDKKVAKLLKENSGVSTVLVGPPSSQFAEAILKHDGIDIAARFEYDFTVRDIIIAMERGESLSNIAGISYKENGKVIHNPDREFIRSEELDSIPFVSGVYKRHLNIKDYFLSSSLYPEVQIFSGRGCPHLCTFCSWPETLMGRKYRTRSIANLVDEFQYIMRELPEVNEIFLEDDTFTVDETRINKFCDEIRRRKLKVTWSCNTRATLDYETLERMKKAGCRLIIVGFESGSDEVLGNIKKGITTQQARRFARDAKKAGLILQGDFMIGLPGETKETIQETVYFIKEIKPHILQLNIATPIPGTVFYQWAEENDFLLADDLEQCLDRSGSRVCVLSYPELSHEDIEEYVGHVLKGYYLSPSYIPIAFRNILRRTGLQELRIILKSARGLLRYLKRPK